MTMSDKASVEGSFQRNPAGWRQFVSSKKDAIFKPEVNRYHLYVSYACPWAHRTLMVRALKGLEDVISVTVVHPTWKKTRPNDPNDTHNGWFFVSNDDSSSNAKPFRNTIGLGGPFPPTFAGCEPDPSGHNFQFIRDIYEYAGDTAGTYSVPILWDKKLDTIVNNESSDIIRMFNSEFNAFAENPELDLYDAKDRTAIDQVNEWVYPTINNGVYRCGFAKTQEAYNVAIHELNESLDRVATILRTQKFIAGNQLTEADIRLFATLLRFDEVYLVYFKCNTCSVAESPLILDYCRRIYQLKGIADTCNMEHIKFHYYTSHPSLNRLSIIPEGPNFMSLLATETPTVNGRKRKLSNDE